MVARQRGRGGCGPAENAESNSHHEAGSVARQLAVNKMLEQQPPQAAITKSKLTYAKAEVS